MANESVLPLGPVETLNTAGALLERARNMVGATTVTVDCHALEQADSAGLQVLLALRSSLSARGGVLRVINVPPDLAWRFDFAGLVYTTA